MFEFHRDESDGTTEQVVNRLTRMLTAPGSYGSQVTSVERRTAYEREDVVQQRPALRGPSRAESRELDLMVVRSELDRLTKTRRTSPLVGDDAADYARLCDRELHLLGKQVAAL